MPRWEACLWFGWFVAATVGCGTEIAQTAVYRGEAGRPGFTGQGGQSARGGQSTMGGQVGQAGQPSLDCTSTNVATSLPSDPNLGGGDRIASSSLLTSGYLVGDGPGILVAGRDAFRLYVNGEMLADSTESLSPRFIGYTFLPGKNVVAIVVTAKERAPFVAVRIDELADTYVSSGAWKVTANPGENWTQPDYDDTEWAQAIELGATDAAGSCASAGALFGDSGAHWIGSAQLTARTIALRFSLDILPSGFGEKATGGDRAPVQVVDSYSALRDAVSNDAVPRGVVLNEGQYDFRLTGSDIKTQATCPTLCESSTVTQYIVIPKDGTCAVDWVTLSRNERSIKIRANKTIVGLGRGARLRGAWFNLSLSSNVILRNLAWYDVNPGIIEAGDALTFDATTRVWVDHCTFKWISDGFTDLANNSTEITFSWLRFDGQNDAECRQRHLRSNEVIDSVATYHHCFWQQVDGRAPFVHGASARVHLYNNVVVDSLDYAVGSGCLGQVLLEGSYFEATAAATSRRDCVESPGELGLIRVVPGTDVYDAQSNVHLSAQSSTSEPLDTVFLPTYSYQLESASDIQVRVPKRAGAGAIWALPLKLE